MPISANSSVQVYARRAPFDSGLCARTPFYYTGTAAAHPGKRCDFNFVGLKKNLTVSALVLSSTKLVRAAHKRRTIIAMIARTEIHTHTHTRIRTRAYDIIVIGRINRYVYTQTTDRYNRSSDTLRQRCAVGSLNVYTRTRSDNVSAHVDSIARMSRSAKISVRAKRTRST